MKMHIKKDKIELRSGLKVEKVYIYLAIFFIFGFILGVSIPFKSNAEQMGSSPDTGGAQSVLVGSYNSLVSKGTNYGSSSSPDWTLNWGTYWNRIMYSATWEPDGTATTSDVLSGKTFYSGSNNRTIQTGTVASGFPIDYSQEQFVEYDDYYASDYTGEESSWYNTNTTSGSQVWYDTRTGLYWSSSIGSYTNSFSSPSTGSCDFFNTGTYPTRGSYGTSGTDPACGDAINACAVLSLASTEGGPTKDDWYLPSQKELQRAYRDGIHNKTSAAFTTTSDYWSATENSGITTHAWLVILSYGSTVNNLRSIGYAARCVRRD